MRSIRVVGFRGRTTRADELNQPGRRLERIIRLRRAPTEKAFESRTSVDDGTLFGRHLYGCHRNMAGPDIVVPQSPGLLTGQYQKLSQPVPLSRGESVERRALHAPRLTH